MLLLFQESFNKNRVVSLAEILFKHKPIAQRSEQCFNKNRVVSLPEILFKHKPIAQRSEQCFNKSQTATSSGFYYTRKGTGLQEGRFCQRGNKMSEQ